MNKGKTILQPWVNQAMREHIMSQYQWMDSSMKSIVYLWRHLFWITIFLVYIKFYHAASHVVLANLKTRYYGALNDKFCYEATNEMLANQKREIFEAFIKCKHFQHRNYTVYVVASACCNYKGGWQIKRSRLKSFNLIKMKQFFFMDHSIISYFQKKHFNILSIQLLFT